MKQTYSVFYNKFQPQKLMLLQKQDQRLGSSPKRGWALVIKKPALVKRISPNS